MGKINWFLIRELAVTDFKLRYNNSILGYLWSLLNPLLMFTVLYVVFSIFLRFDGIEHYQLYLLLGILLWSYFSEATNNGMASMQYKSTLISKVNFSKWVIIVASNFTSLLTLILNLIVFSIFYLYADVSYSTTILLFPIIMLLLIIFTFSVSLILSSYYLKFKDLQHIWNVVLQIGFWLTPIIYPLAMVPEKVRFLLFMNPMARIIIDARNSIIYNQWPHLSNFLITIIILVIILFLGIAIFNKRSQKFAEEI